MKMNQMTKRPKCYWAGYPGWDESTLENVENMKRASVCKGNGGNFRGIFRKWQKYSLKIMKQD